ncbi:MAG: flagellin [Phycisphaerae bacterium]
MTRINTNVNSLISQRVLNQNNKSLNESLTRLSTGLKINSGKDNPAGLIASENLRAEKTGISQAMANAERANNIIATAEGGLTEISALLNEMQQLVGEAANSGGLSPEELDANQLQVDSILSTMNRLAQSTSFQGVKLLNGNFDYQTSGLDTTNVGALRVNAARLPDNSSQNVVVEVVTSAQTATLTGPAAALGGAATIEIAGNDGTEQISLTSGATTADMAAAINSVKTATGVSATVSGGSLRMDSTEFGSDQFVSVKTIAGTFTTSGNKDTGRDAVVQINGARAEAKGLDVSFRASNLDIEFTLQSAMNSDASADSFSITGGGGTFALGSKVTETDKASIGIASVTTGSLGGKTGKLGELSSGGANALTGDNLVKAQKIISEATKQVSQLRGRLGAFQKFTIGSTINALGVAYENASAAESSIRDTDFAQETSKLTRSQILAQASNTVLSQANSAPQSALQLLG